MASAAYMKLWRAQNAEHVKTYTTQYNKLHASKQKLQQKK